MTKNKNKKSSEAAKQEAFKLSDGICYCKTPGHAISNVTGINHLTFRTITDYLILVIYQLKLLHVSKSEMKRIISRFEYIVEKLRSNIPINIFNQIIRK